MERRPSAFGRSILRFDEPGAGARSSRAHGSAALLWEKASPTRAPLGGVAGAEPASPATIRGMSLALPALVLLALAASPKTAGRWSVERVSADPRPGASRRVLTYVPAACASPRTRGPPAERPSADRF